MEKITARDIAKMIDHSLLNPVITPDDVANGCAIAKKYNTASVCVKPCDVDQAVLLLKETDVAVTTVISFPHGSNLTEVKVFEAQKALKSGCSELDMVLNIGWLLGGRYSEVMDDIRAVCDIAHAGEAIVKVILENAYLKDELIEIASKLSERAGADFIKTSTGYAPSGAKLHDLRIMRAATSGRVGIKAAGGIRTLDAALKIRSIGVSRFGCTVTEKIVSEAREREAAGSLILPEIVDEEF
jgi:deoxyribose-phosphate aldolase